MAECLRKSFQDSLNGIKQCMKEKRNRKWVVLGKTTQFSTLKAKTPTSKMKIIQANNRDLALSLQEEKLKLKQAEATILQLKRDYHDLKAQMFALKRNHRFQQEEGLVEKRLLDLKEVISKVSRNLLELVDLLGLAKSLCSIDINQKVVSSGPRNSCSVTGPAGSTEPLQCANGDGPVLPSGTDPGVESDSDISLTKIISHEGQTSDIHVNNTGSELENTLLSGKPGFGRVLPKNSSPRCSFSKIRNFNVMHTGVLDHLEAPDSVEELSEENKIRLEESLEKCATENLNAAISHLNESKVDSEQVWRQKNSETSQFNLKHNSDLKQPKCKSRKNSQGRKEKNQKGELKQPKNTSQQGPGKPGKEASKKNLNFLGGISDAYDFNLEERVHVTPFRQSKVNNRDTALDDTEDSAETDSTESSNTEDDLDDNLYEPYKKISKKRQRSEENNAASPIHERPKSKRCLAQREQHLRHEEETENSKSSDKSTGQPSEPSHGHLCDVTNTAALLPSTGDAATAPQSEGAWSPKCRRKCSLPVNYKEPSISRKLRRGDPFTDTKFLRSPIFKKQKNP
ncbi:shugoshin 1 [Pithys albifrons albifrons]|uniref:shugoshin 1 n=1 Tax=Pithys albifrons albifrons TaxID=3385563 RepID=UPI003A5CD43C